MEQVVVHGHLVLGVVVGALPADGGVADDGDAARAAVRGWRPRWPPRPGVAVAVESAADEGPGPAAPAAGRTT